MIPAPGSRRVEEPPSALLEERPWLEAALAAMRDGVIVFDAVGRVAHANPAALAYAARNALSRDPKQWPVEHGIFLPDQTTPYPPDALPVWRVLRGENVRDAEIFVRNANVPAGAFILVSGNPLCSTEGNIRGAVLSFRDNTERRAKDRKIFEAEQQKKAILDNIPDIAWLKDVEGRFLAVNRPLAESAGLGSPEEVVGLTDHHLWPKELADGYREADLEVQRTGRPIRVEERFVAADGRVYWIESIKAPVLGPSGEVIGTTGIARDVTERRRVEEALRQMNDELERRVHERTAELAEAQETLVRNERLAVLGQLAGGVAHQIRNPLAAIMNATYVLKRHCTQEHHPDVDHALRIIHDEVRHANVIITSLLDFARVRSLDRQPTSIVEMVDRAFASQPIPEVVRVERHLEDVPAVNVDIDQIQSALANVIRNALEAMPAGGVLRVDVKQVEGEIVVAVSDTGPGLSPQIRAHVFDPLYSTKPLGIGLGLVTARTFVEAHGGRIAAIDVPEGARFEISLPIT